MVVNAMWHCGNYHFRGAGERNYCEVRDPSGASGGMGRDGGMAEVVALTAAGQLRPHITKCKLVEAADVFQKLQEGKISGRAVLIL